MVLISIILNLSSTLGPTIGGFLTDAFSWHWLFLVNIVPGIIVAAMVWFTIDIDKPDPSLLRNFDLIGLVLMATFLGCLEYVLEEGSRWDWLDDSTIRTAMIVSAIAGVFFFWRVLTYRQPIVDLRVLSTAISRWARSYVSRWDRDVQHHLSGAAVPGPGAGLQQPGRSARPCWSPACCRC